MGSKIGVFFAWERNKMDIADVPLLSGVLLIEISDRLSVYDDWVTPMYMARVWDRIFACACFFFFFFSFVFVFGIAL